MSTAYTGAARKQAYVDFWASLTEPEESLSGRFCRLNYPNVWCNRHQIRLVSVVHFQR